MGKDYYIITTPAVEYPITLAEAKAACRITTTAEDDLISALIIAATAKLEEYTNRVFVERSFTGFFECLECSKFEKGYFLAIRRAPLQSVSSVELTENEILAAVSSDYYDLKETPSFARIVFNGEGSFSPDRIPYPWQVDFVAGHGDAVDVPELIKMAIKQYVCFLYRNRGDCADAPGMPDTVKAIADEWRIVNTYG